MHAFWRDFARECNYCDKNEILLQIHMYTTNTTVKNQIRFGKFHEKKCNSFTNTSLSIKKGTNEFLTDGFFNVLHSKLTLSIGRSLVEPYGIYITSTCRWNVIGIIWKELSSVELLVVVSCRH